MYSGHSSNYVCFKHYLRKSKYNSFRISNLCGSEAVTFFECFCFLTLSRLSPCRESESEVEARQKVHDVTLNGGCTGRQEKETRKREKNKLPHNKTKSRTRSRALFFLIINNSLLCHGSILFRFP